MARAMAAGAALLAQMEEDVGEVRLLRRVDDVGGRSGRVADMRMSSGPSRLEREAARGIVELHRGDADVEHDAVGRREAGGSPAMRSSSPKRPSTSVSRPWCCSTSAPPGGNGGRVAVDAEHARAGRGGQDRLGCSRRRRTCRQCSVRRPCGASACSTWGSSTGTWRTVPLGAPSAGRVPRVAIIPVLLPRRPYPPDRGGSPRRTACDGPGLSRGRARAAPRSARAPTSGICCRGRQK